MATSLLREEPGGWCTTKPRGSIDIDHEKKVDLGVLRGADHDGHVPVSPFSTVDGVCVKLKVTFTLCLFGETGTHFLDSAPST